MTPPSAAPSSAYGTPPPYLHLQDRPYLLQPIDLETPMAGANKVRPSPFVSLMTYTYTTDPPSIHSLHTSFPDRL